MTPAEPSGARLIRAYERLSDWLLTHAYPRWAADGVNAATGGFVEAIERDGTVVAQPLRLRVQARQVFAFAGANLLGWPIDTATLIRRGLDYLSARFERADGLFRTLVGADGRAIDERALLYDQAFVLLAFAAAGNALGSVDEMEQRARVLRSHIERRMRAADGTFFSDTGHSALREFNPHMHLLEACLAWSAIGRDPEWHDWAGDMIELAGRRFLRADIGLLGETYRLDWRPAPGTAGRIIEPGHQFEWAWLLLSAMDRHGEALGPVALELIQRAERSGVRRGIVVNALLDDLSVHDGDSRLWPQTERLKAALAAGRISREDHHTADACTAAESLFVYLNEETPGLWFDLRLASGVVQRAGAPASTLYHLVGAILELHRTLGDQAD